MKERKKIMKRMNVGQLVLIAVLVFICMAAVIWAISVWNVTSTDRNEQAWLDRTWPWYLLFASDRMRINGADVFQ